MNRLQRWICARAPWLSRACWPPEEYLSAGQPADEDDSTPQSGVRGGALKAQFDRETRELARTVKALDAQIDVMAGTDRLRVYGHGPRRAHQHQRGG